MNPMDLSELISDLHLELEQIDRAIRCLERLAGSSSAKGVDRQSERRQLKQVKAPNSNRSTQPMGKVMVAHISENKLGGE